LTIYAPQIRALWRTLESYGLDPSRAIPAGLYRPGAQRSGSERISPALVDEVVDRAVALIDDPAIGLRTADFLHPSHLGALGHAWMAAATLRDAIHRSQRYHRMLNECLVVEVSDGPDVLKVTYHHPEDIQRPDVQADISLSWLLRLCRLNTGRELLPAFVHMRREAPADAGPWARYFGMDVDFGQAEDSLAIHPRDADRELTGFSPQLVAVNEEIMQRHVARLDRSDIVNRARVAILDQLPSGDVNEEGVAALLNMSPRTLYNYLRSHGTSFRELLAELRRELVQRYLPDASYSITEVSFLLGYSDTSAFSRAFRTWYGVSPTAFREAGG